MKPYPAYKDSGLPWLGYIPTNWHTAPTFVVLRERHVPNVNLKEKTLLSLSYGHIVVKDIDSTFGLLPASFETYQIVEPGNIILRFTDLQNDQRSLRVGLAKHLGIITSAYLCLATSHTIIPEYAYYQLHSLDTQKIFYSMGGGLRQSMGYEDLRRMVFLLPPLDEQAAIAAYLDRKIADIEQFISKKQQLITLLNEQKAAIINQSVTKGLNLSVPMQPSGTKLYPYIPVNWKMTRLRYVCTKVADGPHFSPEYVDDGFPFYSARNITAGGWDFTDVKYVSEQNYTEFSRKIEPKRGDVLYTKGGTTGVAKAVDLDYPFQVWVHIAVLKLDHDVILPRYLEYALNGDACYQQSQLETRGATNKDLGLTRMINIIFGLPTLTEQSQIVDYLDAELQKIKSAITRIEREIELIQEYRTTLISEVVTGKIDVREAVDAKNLAANLTT